MPYYIILLFAILILLYHIGFPGYLTVLLAFDFYYIFLCYGIALKIELSCKLPAEFCNLRWIRERYIAPIYHESKLVISLLIISKNIVNSNYLNKLRLSIKLMVRDLVNKPRPLLLLTIPLIWKKSPSVDRPPNFYCLH